MNAPITETKIKGRTYTVENMTVMQPGTRADDDMLRRGWDARAILRGVRGACMLAFRAKHDGSWHPVIGF